MSGVEGLELLAEFAARSEEGDGDAPGVVMLTCSHAALSMDAARRSCPDPACLTPFVSQVCVV